jgi:hypothetical protein
MYISTNIWYNTNINKTEVHMPTQPRQPGDLVPGQYLPPPIKAGTAKIVSQTPTSVTVTSTPAEQVDLSDEVGPGETRGETHKIILVDQSGMDPDILVCITGLDEARKIQARLIDTFRELNIFYVGAVQICGVVDHVNDSILSTDDDYAALPESEKS